jgi:hypothetical protein
MADASRRIGPRRLAGLLLGTALLASGCAIDPARHAQRLLAEVPAPALAEARALATEGQPAAAAEAYLALAENATVPARQQLELEAAKALLQAGDPDGAERLLQGLDRSVLTQTQRESAALLQADLALSRGRASAAIAALEDIDPQTLPPTLQHSWYGTMAAAYRLRNQPVRAAQALNRLDDLLKERKQRLDNQVSLLFTLTSLPPSQLDEAARTSRGELRGWVELARLLASRSLPSAELDTARRSWSAQHPKHPALPELSEAYFIALSGSYPAASRALVLLPTTGRFSAAGQIIQSGINAAHAADRGATRPRLDFRSDHGTPDFSAVTEGADLVIGPLVKRSVSALAGSGALPVPTLALNRTHGASAENLFQFALAPEDEAVSAANHAFAAGVRRAAILSPEGAWGTRMATAFRNQWRALGGQIVAQPRYGSIFEGAATVARSDAEIVLLVATTATVAELWTEVRAAGFKGPVIATSHVYDGTFDRQRHARLAGLYFVDIPWLLDQQRSDRLSRQALRARLPSISGPLARLYAMGIDAYRLAPRAAAMRAQPGTFFPGETGGLSIDARGEVHRQLTLARFTASGVTTPERLIDATRPGASPQG